LVDQFPVDSQVSVIATDGDRPFFSVDVAAAKRRIETLELNFSGSSVPAAILAGLPMLAKAPQERKEIYVVTDLTRESWAGENPKPLFRQLEKDLGTSLFVIDVGIEDTTNFALTELNISDVEISPQGRLNVMTEIQRKGPAAQRTARMTIEKPDPPLPVVRDEHTLFPQKAFDSQSVTKDIRENGSGSVKFTFSEPLEFGTYHGKVEVEGQDGLAIDNTRYFTIRVGRIKRALVVHPSNVNPRVMQSLLAPKDKVESGTAKFECTTVTQTEFLGYDDLDEYDAIHLLNPTPIGDDQWQLLERFVRDGGGLGVYLGHNAADGGLVNKSFATESAQRVLAGQLQQQWFNEEPDLFLSPLELSHPIFDLIRGNETSVLWNQFPVFIHWGTEDDGNSTELPTQVLLRFGNQEPAIIERAIGSGRVLVLTTPITEYGFVEGRPKWNSLLTGNPVPAFLLLSGIVSHLVENDTESLNVSVGETASFDNNLQLYPENYQVFSPVETKPPTALNTVDGKVRYRFVDHPGHFRFKGVINQNVVLRGFSANLDQSATGLSRIEPAELDAFLGPGRVVIPHRFDSKHGVAARYRRFDSLGCGGRHDTRQPIKVLKACGKQN